MTSVLPRNLRTIVRNIVLVVRTRKHHRGAGLSARCFVFIFLGMGFLMLSDAARPIFGSDPGIRHVVSSAGSGQLKWGRQPSTLSRGTTQHSLSVARRIDDRIAPDVDSADVPAPVMDLDVESQRCRPHLDVRTGVEEALSSEAIRLVPWHVSAG